MDVREITKTVKDLNAEDRVFEADGLVVKIKTLHDDEHSTTGQEIYRISGAVCDPQGKALEDGREGLHVYNFKHTCTVQSYSDNGGSLIEKLQPSIDVVIGETAQAYRNFKDRRAGLGVGSMSEFKARKALG